MDKNRRAGVVSNYQLFSLVFNLMVATGVFTIARTVSAVAGRGVVLSIPLAGLLALTQLTGMYLLAKRFPDKSLPEYAPIILGKVIGYAYLFGYFLMNIGIAILIARNFWVIIDAWDLHTPSRIFLSLLTLVSWNVARRGVIVLSRVSELMLALSVPVLLFIIMPHSGLDFDHLRPILDRSPLDLVKGVLPAYFAMVGFDVLLFVYPFSGRKQAMKMACLATMSATLLYTVVSVLIVTTLGMERTLSLTWPMQSYLNNFAFAIVDRLDVIFLMIWTWQVFMSVTIPLFMAGACLRGILPSLGSRRAADLCLALLLTAAVLPIDLPTQAQALEIYSNIAIVYVGSLPFMLWLVALLRKKGGGISESEKSKNVA